MSDTELMNKTKRTKLRKIVMLIFMALAFSLWAVLTDPNSRIITDLSYGIELILTLKIFLFGSIIIMIMEQLLDHYRGDVIKYETVLIENAKKDPVASSLAMIALSVRIASYAIVFAAVMISLSLPGL